MIEKNGDAILPSEIEHNIDEVWHDGHLEQYYNFVDYHFERDGGYCRARAYADSFGEVVLYGPFAGRRSITATHNVSLENDVWHYLERRFTKISRR